MSNKSETSVLGISDEAELYGELICFILCIKQDKETGESRGVAYVKFYRASHAAFALEEASPEYKAILADPRPPKGGPVVNHNSAAPTAPGFHYNSGGASYTAATAAYAPPAPTAVYGGSKGAAGPDSTGVGLQNLLHPNQGKESFRLLLTFSCIGLQLKFSSGLVRNPIFFKISFDVNFKAFYKFATADIFDISFTKISYRAIFQLFSLQVTEL